MMELTKIQINQVEFPVFLSSSGDFSISQGKNVDIELVESITGDFEITGSLSLNGDIVDGSSLGINDNYYLFEDFDNDLLNSSGNVFLDTKHSLPSKNTNNNLLCNVSSVSFRENSSNNTIIGLNSFYNLNINDSVLFFAKENGSEASRLHSNSIVIDCDNGNYFDGDSFFLSKTTLNNAVFKSANIGDLSCSSFVVSGYFEADSLVSESASFQNGAWGGLIELNGNSKISNDFTDSSIVTEKWVNEQNFASSSNHSLSGVDDLTSSGYILIEGSESPVSKVGNLFFDTGDINVPSTRINQSQNKETFIEGLFSGNTIVYIEDGFFVSGFGGEEIRSGDFNVATESWVTGQGFLTGLFELNNRNLILSSLELQSDIKSESLFVSGYYNNLNTGSNSLVTNDVDIETNQEVSFENLEVSGSLYVTKNINIGSLSDLDFGGGFYVKDLTSSSASNINLSNSAQLTGSDLATESWFDTYPSELSSNKEIVDLTSTGNVGLFDSSIIETLTLPYLAGPNPDNYPSININSNSVYFNNVAIPTNTQVLAPDQNFPKIKSTGYSPHNFIKIQKSSSLNIGSGNLWNTSIDSGQALTKISNKGYITIPKTNVESLHQPSGFRLEKISVDNFKVSPDPTAVKLNIISGTKQTDDYDPSYLRVSDLNEKLSNWAFDSPFTEVIHRDKYMQIWLDILNRDNPYLSWTFFNRVLPTAKNVNLFWKLFTYWYGWVNGLQNTKPNVKPYVENFLNLVYNSKTKANAAGQSGQDCIVGVWQDYIQNQGLLANEDTNVVDWDDSDLEVYSNLFYSVYQKTMWDDLLNYKNQYAAYDTPTYDNFGLSDILKGKFEGEEIYYMSFPSAWIPQSDSDVNIDSSKENKFKHNLVLSKIDDFSDYRYDSRKTVRPYFRTFNPNETFNPLNRYETINTDCWSDFYTVDSLLYKSSKMFMSKFPNVLDNGSSWQDQIPDSHQYDGGGWKNGSVHNRVFPDLDLIPSNLSEMTYSS
jgi:hypothetical protein